MKLKDKGELSSVKIHMVNIDDVMENPTNPRTISKIKIEELAESMVRLPKMFKYRYVVVDRYTGFLLAGNQRYRASKMIGLTQIPVAYSDEMTTAQKKEFVIRDNIENGAWNKEKLDFSFADFPLVQWGILPETAEPTKRDQDRSSVAEDRVTYDNGTIRQIVVYYDSITHGNVAAELEKIREENNLGDNSEVLLFLLEEHG